ncbi:hypothetical protein MPTK1_4g00190 [Marchantia polymorpha subsp. ruderalis]|uniref:Uncharacterized protein n=2 Tax=Marchantia polymorpha TaxID=3197 RepID=A0AAF6B4S4_MARPO|nr:hypothetical protein MARPO_0162s0002 [Marchantia polymorpha]BBN07008.1 hypothetical protein Mp_4g00190 [Marchantia polymorpha subsp. ruderalis]|eukprot:PTQ28469.1 hypothetical protein MARPO_0162s0002 [Marchantia polymorpha]
MNNGRTRRGLQKSWLTFRYEERKTNRVIPFFHKQVTLPPSSEGRSEGETRSPMRRAVRDMMQVEVNCNWLSGKAAGS